MVKKSEEKPVLDPVRKPIKKAPKAEIAEGDDEWKEHERAQADDAASEEEAEEEASAEAEDKAAEEEQTHFLQGDSKKKRNLKGWKRDTPDHRDRFFASEFELFDALPGVFSLRNVMPPVYDQGQEGACTAFACDSTVTSNQMRQNLKAYELSHNFTYWNTRSIEGTTGRDSGAACRDVLRSYSKFGFAAATTYPYNTKQVLSKPPQAAYDEGLKNIVQPVQYARVNQNLTEIKSAVSLGLPVFLGMDVFRQLMSQQAANTGVLTMPSRRERPIGGHAVTIVGWDDTKQMFEWRNSWGDDWGDDGYGWMPYAMTLNTQITGDLWVLRTLTSAT